MSKNKKKHTRNLSISTRLTITTVLSVVIPVILLITFSSVFSSMLASYFNKFIFHYQFDAMEFNHVVNIRRTCIKRRR